MNKMRSHTLKPYLFGIINKLIRGNTFTSIQEAYVNTYVSRVCYSARYSLYIIIKKKNMEIFRRIFHDNEEDRSFCWPIFSCTQYE